jgi:hypothetical protein
MKTLLIVLLLGFRSLGAETNSPPSTNGLPHDQGQLMVKITTSQFNGTNYIGELRLKDLWDTPRWNASDKPPLSPEKAESIGRRGLEQQLSWGGDLELSGNLPLKPWFLSDLAIHRFVNRDIWYYEVRMVPFFNGSYNWPPVIVFITMDGHMGPLRIDSTDQH